jgi:hypothetical protein
MPHKFAKALILTLLGGKVASILFCAVLALFFSISVSAQKRDNLTDTESDQVRDAQQLDLRMQVFIKAIDRRVQVLNGVAPSAKDTEKWGAPPKGTRVELLRDIEKILDEAISNIDDAAAHNANSPFFSQGIHLLADGAQALLPQLKVFQSKAAGDLERGSLMQSIEYCDQIIEAAVRVPKVETKKKKKN